MKEIFYELVSKVHERGVFEIELGSHPDAKRLRARFYRFREGLRDTDPERAKVVEVSATVVGNVVRFSLDGVRRALRGALA